MGYVLGLAVAAVIAEGRQVTYDLKENRDDPTAVGTREMADAIIEKTQNPKLEIRNKHK